MRARAPPFRRLYRSAPTPFPPAPHPSPPRSGCPSLSQCFTRGFYVTHIADSLRTGLTRQTNAALRREQQLFAGDSVPRTICGTSSHFVRIRRGVVFGPWSDTPGTQRERHFDVAEHPYSHTACRRRGARSTAAPVLPVANAGARTST